MKKKKKKKLVIFIIVCLVLVVLLVSRNTASKNNGNLSNMGLVAEKNGTIYYNKYEKGIFAVKGGKEKQLTDESAYSINIVDDKIYYLTVENFNDVVIKCVDIKGEKVTNIATIYTSISKIFVEDGYIYYSTNKGNGGVARVDLNGQNEEIIIDKKVRDFHVAKDYVFYINEQNQICKILCSGKEKNVLAENIVAEKIQVIDNWIYYYDEIENALFRIDENAKKNELISVLVNNEVYNVAGNYVYYLDMENSKISRMQIGNSNKCEDVVRVDTLKTKINIAKDQLYYLDKSQDESQTYQIYRVKVNGESIQEIKY